MSYSRAIRDAIIAFLKEDDWHYEMDEEREVIKMGLNLDNKLKNSRILIDLRDDKYMVYFSVPLNTDESERPEMARLLNRINYGLMFGCFEMDEKDGEVRFRYSVDCDGAVPTSAMVRHSLYRPAMTLDKYGNAIVQVLMGVATAEEAYSLAQKKDRR